MITKYWHVWGFAVCAAILFAYVIFTPPLTGVADNNDFSRSMYGIMYQDIERYYSVEKNTYVNTEYTITPFPHKVMLGRSLSPVYSVYATRLLSRLLGYTTFQMNLYCMLTGAVYIALLTALYGFFLPRGTLYRLLLGAAMLLVFLDGCWVMWWYTLYGEPHILLGIAALCVFFLAALRAEDKAPVWALLGTGVSGLYLLGAKLQAIVLLPAAAAPLVLLAVRIWKRRGSIRRAGLKTALCAALIPLLLLRSVVIYGYVSRNTNGETLYQSVFFGLLMDSPEPQKALRELGLNPVLIADVGNHSYLSADRYVLGGRNTENMQKEFYSKVSNGTIARYYLRHPDALLRGMGWLASQSLRADSGLGKHTEADAQRFDPMPKGIRFSFWNSLRSHFPKKLWFLLLIGFASLGASVAVYRKSRDSRLRAGCVCFWIVFSMGVLQFPLPYIFNGHADTAKQLFTFNYIFDVAFFALACIVFGAVNRFIHERGGDARGGVPRRR